MKKYIILILIAISTIVCPSVSGANGAYILPPAVQIVFKQLEETYRILDLTAEKTWTGWTGYQEVPFRFQFNNGLVVLINHPQPPDGFELLTDILVAGRKVYVDKRNVSSLSLVYPFQGGGGIIPFGTDENGKSIRIIDLKLNNAVKDTAIVREKGITEKQILIYIHELFHVFQNSMLQYRYGNLNYNPDKYYSVYSGIEGRALEQAWFETNPEMARGFMKDFLYARMEKIHRSMSDIQSKQECDDELMEGTAVYAEIRTLELLKEGYKPGLLPNEDPAYNGFRDIDGLIKEEFADRLKKNAEDLLEAKMKCYQYGCAEALLLQRYFPGWQDSVVKAPRYLFEEMQRRIPVTESDKKLIRQRFSKLYGIDTLTVRANKETGERDRNVKSIAKRDGFSYILNFKPVQHYLQPEKKRKESSLGLVYAYPEGFGDFSVNEIEVKWLDSIPVEKNQLYYLKIVNTNPVKGRKPYEISYESKEEGNIYKNVVITTPLFTIKAPKIAIQETENRVKFSFLSRVKE